MSTIPDWRDFPQSRTDDAIDRGYEPHRDDLLPPPRHVELDDEWQAGLDVVRARAACGEPECGLVRCAVCDERMTCMGPTRVPAACPAHDGECADCNAARPCRDCAETRRSA